MKSTVSVVALLALFMTACSSTEEYNTTPPPKKVTAHDSNADSVPAPQTFAKVDLPKREVEPTATPNTISKDSADGAAASAAGGIDPSETANVYKKQLATKAAPATSTVASIGTIVSTIGENVPIQPETDLNKWKLLNDEDGIKGYEQKEPVDGHVAFRGEMIIPAPLKRVVAVLSDDSVRKDWVDSFADAHVIHLTSPLDRTEYNHIKVSWPFEDRDFVYHAVVKPSRNPNTILLTMTSVEDAAEPKKSGLVRGEIVYSYYYLQELPTNTATRVVVEMSVDTKGAIPKWLVTLAQKKWPHNTLRDLKKLSAREDLVVPAYIQEYFSQKQ